MITQRSLTLQDFEAYPRRTLLIVLSDKQSTELELQLAMVKVTGHNSVLESKHLLLMLSHHLRYVSE